MRHLLFENVVSVYHNQHLLRNKVNIEYFACDKLR